MAVFRVLRQMGIWALVFMMVGCVSPFAYQLVDPNYKPGNLEPPLYGFAGIIVGAVFGLILGIVFELRGRRGISGGTTTAGSGAPTDEKYLIPRYRWVRPADARLNLRPKIALRNILIWLAIFITIIAAYGLLY